MEAVLNTPVGSPRSRWLNQSAVTRAAVGYCGDSQTPSTKRATNNCVKLVMNPQTIWANDHAATARLSTRRGPKRSINGPTGSCANA